MGFLEITLMSLTMYTQVELKEKFGFKFKYWYGNWCAVSTIIYKHWISMFTLFWFQFANVTMHCLWELLIVNKLGPGN